MIVATTALLASVAIASYAFAQPPAGPGPGGPRVGGPGGPAGPGGGRGRVAFPPDDPSPPLAERGGFGPGTPEIAKYREGIYLIRSGASGNITAFTSDNGVLVVDSKFANEYTQIQELLKTVTDQPIRYVINTHFHGDHVGGNANMEAGGAEIIAHDNARVRLSQSQQTGIPVISFADRMTVRFGGKTFQLYHFGRGHTDTDLVIYIPEEKIVMPGDLFASWGPSVRLIDYNGGGSLVQWPATLEKAMALDFDAVIPGHAGVTDRAHMQAYIDENRRMLDMIRMLKEAGKTPQEMTAAIQMEFGNGAFVVLPSIQAILDEMN
jgi:glyoxylase-like metal-dependent hydrolase (beta-lactamase superfamily II)